MPIILVVDDSETDRTLIGGLLKCKLDWIVQYASDGAEASKLVGQIFPDVVITDLQMPEMNGIELCADVKCKHPHVPVLLTTGVGSEALAVEALKAGAASYVPKNNLASSLVETVEQVLAVSGRQRINDCLLTQSMEARYSFELENDQNLILAMVDFLTKEMVAVGTGGNTEQRQASIALEEAMLNAMFHGNLELDSTQVQRARRAFHQGGVSKEVEKRVVMAPYRDRRLFVAIELSKQQVKMKVRDQGNGFDTKERFANAGQLEQFSGSSESGRGLTLIKSFSDKVQFDQAGNTILMTLNIEAHMPEEEVVAS